MIYYLMVAIFVLGMFVGSAKDSVTKPSVIEWAFLILIAAVWPWMTFTIWKEWWATK